MERRSFFMKAFWTVLISLSLFSAVYQAETIVLKFIGFGVVWASVLVVAFRSQLAEAFSWDETKPDPHNREHTVKTGLTLRFEDEFTERIVLALCTFVVLFGLLKFDGVVLTTMLTWASCAAISAAAARRFYKREKRDVPLPQLEVFYTIPGAGSVIAFVAYLSGASIWFSIGLALVLTLVHLRYGYVIDDVEAAALKNVVQLKPTQVA